MTQEQRRTIQAYDNSASSYQEKIARLTNYDSTYDYFAGLLADGQLVVDLACGPANISSYLLKAKKLRVIGIDLSEGMLELARKAIPDGEFRKSSIIDFSLELSVDAIVLGFGLPYLDDEQTRACLLSCARALRKGGFIYLSFMEGSKSGFEKASFGENGEFYIHYHKKDYVLSLFDEIGFSLNKSWALEYNEPDGSITIDNVLVAERN